LTSEAGRVHGRSLQQGQHLAPMLQQGSAQACSDRSQVEAKSERGFAVTMKSH